MSHWEIVAISVTFWGAALFILVSRMGTYKERNSLPGCFGQMPPNPQHQAEYDCFNCPHEGECFFRTKTKTR